MAMTDETRINILLPLPLNVVGALSAAIGAMWPDAIIRTDTPHFTIVVPRKQPKRPSKKRLRDIAAETEPADDEPVAELLAMNPDGGARIGLDSNDEAWQQLAWWAFSVLDAFDATNYVEQNIRTELPDGTPATLVLTAAWSKGQTPHEVRKQVEKERDSLQLQLDRLLARLADHTLPDGLRVGDLLDDVEKVRLLQPGAVLRDRHGDVWWPTSGVNGGLALHCSSGMAIGTPTTARIRPYTPFTILAGPHQPPSKEN